MSKNEELQKQIDELKATVERLQSGETRYENMPKRMQRIRKKAFEKYYGNWDYFIHTSIQIAPDGKSWSDRDYLETGATRMINIIFKHGHNVSNSKHLACVVENEADLMEYEEIANYVMDTMVSKITELRKRHGVGEGGNQSA